jgi:hypothetical protein
VIFGLAGEHHRTLHYVAGVLDSASMSHGRETRTSKPGTRIDWVFYQPGRSDHFSTVFSPDICRIQKEDVADWVQPAFVDHIRKRYKFDLDEDSIQIAFFRIDDGICRGVSRIECSIL